MKIRFIALFVFIASYSFGQNKTTITSIGKGVYVHTSFNTYNGQPFSANGLLIETPSSVLLIDTPWGENQTTELIDLVKKEIKKPITYLIVTHYHDDRVAGIPILKKENTKVISGKLTAEKIKELNYPKSDFISPTDSVFTIDGVKINIFYPGPGHTTDNIVVYLPKEQILFGGCFLKSTEAGGLGNIADANLKEWPASLEKTKAKFPKTKVVIPGHQAWANKSSIEYTLKLLKEKEAKGN